jgi:NAD(P)-dependent dehydrogenase (short-subunit alcohol dehydrogenase family)
MNPLFDLNGKNSLITGAAGLLGVEHAIALSAIGSRVVMCDVDEVQLIKSANKVRDLVDDPEQIIPIIMDVTDLNNIKAVHDQCEEQFGGIHILINNAAIDSKVTSDGIKEQSRLENFSLEQWNMEINVGLTGAMLCAQIFGSSMAKLKFGVILNIASDLSVFAPDQRLYRRADREEHNQPVKPVTYSVIKTGLVGLTRYLATYWAANGVRVNALSPGGIYTNQPEEFTEQLHQLVPLGRMANREEYRGAIQFLCSKASAYMTGQNIVIDGGRSVL